MRYPPLQPPLLWQCFLLAQIFGSLSAAYPLPALVAAAFVIFLDRRLWTPTRLSLFCLIFAASFLYADFRFSRVRDLDRIEHARIADKADEQSFSGDVVQTRGLPGRRLRVILKNVRAENELDALPGLCAWTWDDPPAFVRPLPGQSIRLNRKIRRARAFVNDEGYEIYPMFMAQDIFWRTSSRKDSGDPKIFGTPDYFAASREKIREKFLAALAGGSRKNIAQPQALLVALIFGDRFYVERNTQDNFAAASLAHSLALSGQHLCVAALLAILLVACHSRLNPGLYLRWPRALLAGAATLPLAFLYLWLGGAPASLLRAAAMIAALVYAIWRRKPYAATDILAVALCLILLYNPLAIFDTGLQLSVLCLLILTISGPALNRALSGLNRGDSLPKKIALRGLQIFAFSLLIQIFLLPVNLLYFHMAGWLFALNILWLPLMAMVVLPVAALGLLFSMAPLCGGIAHGLLWLAALPCEFIITLLNFIANLGLFNEPAFVEPLPSILLAFAALLFALFWFRGRERRTRRQKIFLLAVFPLLLLTPVVRLTNALDDELRLEALDVGQGQAVLLRFRGVKILVDGGGSAPETFDMGKNVLRPVLTANESPRIGALINSHPDLDHLGGFFHILNTFEVGALFHNGQDADKRRASLWRDLRLKNSGVALREGDQIRVGDRGRGVRLEVLHPPVEGKFKGNEASLILRLTREGETLAILPGDAGPTALRRIAADYPDLKTRALVAPHHGSDKNFQEDFLKSANPEIVVVSCGYANPWNFPGETVKKWFADRRAPLLSTSSLGRIRIAFRPDGSLSVSGSLPAKDVSD